MQLLTAQEATAKSPAAVTEGLLGALWSDTEVIVDPREAIHTLPGVLRDAFGVEFYFGKTVTAIAHPHLTVGGETWQAEKIFVCSGADFETLYPDLYRTSGITKSKLQMMRTGPQPHGYRIAPPSAVASPSPTTPPLPPAPPYPPSSSASRRNCPSLLTGTST